MVVSVSRVLESLPSQGAQCSCPQQHAYQQFRGSDLGPHHIAWIDLVNHTLHPGHKLLDFNLMLASENELIQIVFLYTYGNPMDGSEPRVSCYTRQVFEARYTHSKQKLHHTLPRLMYYWGVGLDDHTGLYGPTIISSQPNVSFHLREEL